MLKGPSLKLAFNILICLLIFFGYLICSLGFCRLGFIHFILNSLQVEVWTMKFDYGMQELQSALDHVTSVITSHIFGVAKL